MSPHIIFHIVNRGAKKAALFDDADEFDGFESLLRIAGPKFGIQIFAYCLMSNHWHLVIAPTAAGSMSKCMHWLTTTHARRWQLARDAEGLGAVYQGRFRAIPIEHGEHFLWVCRYVERNPLRAGLVAQAQQWKWSSLWQRCEGDAGWLADWPAERGVDWVAHVNLPQTDGEIAAFRTAVSGGLPFGSESFTATILKSDVRRRRGRPPRGSVLDK
jgi:putative transposase